MTILGVAGLGYYGKKRGPKLRSMGASLLQKSACESGKVEIFVQESVNGYLTCVSIHSRHFF